VVSAVIQASFVELTPMCYSRAIFLAHLYCTICFKLSEDGDTKFEIFREQVDHLHFVLLHGAKMFDLLLQLMLLLITCVVFIFV